MNSPLPSGDVINIFGIVKAYKDNPEKGLNLIENYLIERYPLFGSTESFAYNNSGPYTWVYFINSLQRRKYAYSYSIRIYREENKPAEVSLLLKREWDWSETYPTERFYKDPDGDLKRSNFLLFYLQEGEDEEFIKRIMENLIIEDLKSQNVIVDLKPNDVRGIIIKENLY